MNLALGAEMNRDHLWVGKPEGSQMTFVFDEKMKHEDPSMVYLFSAKTGSMNEYKKAFARHRLKTVKGSEKEYAISLYVAWHAKNGRSFLQNVHERATCEMTKHAELIEKKKRQAIRNHKEFIEKLGLEYQGVQPLEPKHRRITHCYACKGHIDSNINIQCASCGWLICSCGSCGCGYRE